MWVGPPAVPAGVDGTERRPALVVGNQRAAQGGLASGVERAVAALVGVARVVAGRVAVPDVHARPGDAYAGGVHHLDRQIQRHALLAFRDVIAHDLGVDVVGALRHLDGECADIGADEARALGGLLLCGGGAGA